MTDEKMKSTKLRTLISSLIFSIILMVFPVLSGAIVVINSIETLQSYLIQGVFMMLSITVPVIFMLITKIKPSQIGFTGMEKGSVKNSISVRAPHRRIIDKLFIGIQFKARGIQINIHGHNVLRLTDGHNEHIIHGINGDDANYGSQDIKNHIHRP